jgi:predicted  nucleic acid-binding Zn-ribbon protein
LTSMRSELSHCQHELTSLRQQNARLQQSLDRSTAVSSDSHAGLQAEVDRYKQVNKLLEQQIKDAYSEVTTSRATIDELRRAVHALDPTRLEALREENETLSRRLQGMSADLEATRTTQASSLAASRSEVIRAEAAAEAAVSEAAAIRRAAAKREEDLTAEVAELSNALAKAQRSLDDKIYSASHNASTGGAGGSAGSSISPELEAQYRREAAYAAESLVQTAKQKERTLTAECESLRRQVDMCNQQIDSMRKAVSELRVEKETQSSAFTAKVATLQAKLDAAQNSGVQARLDALVKTLQMKQDTLDRYASECSTLSRQLTDEKSARGNLEYQLTEAKRHLRALVAVGIGHGADDSISMAASGTFKQQEDIEAVAAEAVEAVMAQGHDAEVEDALARPDANGSSRDRIAHGQNSASGGSSRDASGNTVINMSTGGASASSPSHGNYPPLQGVLSGPMHTPPAKGRAGAGGTGSVGLKGTGGNRSLYERLSSGATAPAMLAVTPMKRIGAISRHQNVADAADMLDRFFVRTGRFLFANPSARLVFMGYLLLLHSWTLFILMFHTHALPHDAHNHGGASPKIPGTGRAPGVFPG